MEVFQKTIVIVAIFILIITLVLIGFALSYSKATNAWPPIVPECPDYWTLDASNNRCTNPMNLGTCTTLNLSDSRYQGSTGACNKYNWAKQCGVSWDGITYGVKSPCIATT